MNRRNFASAVALLTGLYAGCTTLDRGSDDDGDPGSSTPTPTESPQETPSDSTTETPTDSTTETPTDSTTETPTESSTESPQETPSDSTTETPTESATETPSKSGAVTDTSFEIISNECGTGEDEASVEQGNDRVIVRGTISGRNGCFTAELERADYDTDAGEMTVAVRSYSSSGGNGGCTECIVDIEYRATVSYDASDPETVTVLHNDERVD